MIKRKGFSAILSAILIASSVFTMNVSAAETQKENKGLTVSQQAQMQKEIKELPLKNSQVQEKIQEQKNTLKDSKMETGVQGVTTSPDGPMYAYGTYPTRSGVILVTTDNTTFGIEHGHAGIILTSTQVVESLTSGVCRMPNTWNNYYNVVYGVTVSGTTASQDTSAANWCNGQVGKPYNYVFTDTSTRSKFYCSHLVWAAFKDLYGINLDDDGGIIWPVDLVNTNNTYIVYQK